MVKDVGNDDVIEGYDDDDDKDEVDDEKKEDEVYDNGGLVGWSPDFWSAGMNHCQT